MLWLYQRVFFGEITHEENRELEDVNLREILTLAPLIALCFAIGLFPKPFFDMTAKSAEKIVAAVAPAKLDESAPRMADVKPAGVAPAVAAVAGK
jgi:NADH-quinone oxidoreductase subunit M